MFYERGQNFIDSEDLVRILQPLMLDDRPPSQVPRKKKRACNPNISRIWSSNTSCST